jgi:N4-gp56 family major capsid protein
MADNVYGGISGASSHGQNTIIHYYDKAGVKAANAQAVYAQFSDRRSMPLKRGMTYKVSKWLHIYDREVTDGDFAAKGYLTARNIADVSDGLTATDGTGASLLEGSGATNKRSIKKVTIETSFSRYGEMIDYTDEVEMFSEDMVQVHYREELGKLANMRAEDLVQLDMLATTTVMYAGLGTSLSTVADEVTAVDDSDDYLAQINYDLIRKGVRKLVRNRAEKNTSIVSGSTKIDTRTVNKAFYAIVGPEVKFDLENVIRGSVAENGSTEFAYVPAYKYSAATNLAEGETGAMGDVRFIESETAVVYRGAGAVVPVGYAGSLSTTVLDATSAASMNAFTGTSNYANAEERFDVFPILFPTKGAFATVGLKGQGKIKFNSQAPSKIELGNPYGTTGFFSYNMWYAGIILREERLMKMMVAASQ